MQKINERKVNTKIKLKNLNKILKIKKQCIYTKEIDNKMQSKLPIKNKQIE
jgi:hypothetical protein